MAANRLLEFRRRGYKELIAKLEGLAPLLRRRYLMKALKKGAAVVRRKATTPGVVPVLAAPIYRGGKLYRKPGTLKQAIRIRSSKDAAKEGNVGAFVNVLPAKGAFRGANSPHDPFYWRFVEFGTKKMKARRFLTIGSQELSGAAFEAVKLSLAPDLQQLNLPGFVKT